MHNFCLLNKAMHNRWLASLLEQVRSCVRKRLHCSVAQISQRALIISDNLVNFAERLRSISKHLTLVGKDLPVFYQII